MVKVMLAPDYEKAKGIVADITVEAEYGTECVQGRLATLAHHGARSGNPAPCNWPDVPKLEDGTILVSHLDLDTVGGVLDAMGMKHPDDAFWKGAEFIDVNGVHHVHELPQEVQDKLNAVYAWNEKQGRTRYTEVTDVTAAVMENAEMLKAILDEKHPEHAGMLQAGREWSVRTAAEVEARLYSESRDVRAFVTDGLFCAAGYYSPTEEKVKAATVVYNTKFKAITVAFEDGGAELHADEIVKGLWGAEAGGRPGIAGSPRGREMTMDDFLAAVGTVEKMEELHKEQESDITDGFDDIDEDEPEL